MEKLPNYSEQVPVTDEDKAIFDAACSSYQFPLGTPSTVGKRETADSKDYKFIVKGRGMDGSESISTIYVTARYPHRTAFRWYDNQGTRQALC